MEETLIAAYILTNIFIIIIYYKKDLGVFQAPFIVGCISLTIMLPQLTTIYFQPYYDKQLLYKLCYVMITGNIFFAIGFNMARKKKLPVTMRTLQLSKMRYLTLFFSLIGFSTVFLYGSLNNTIDSVVAANLKSFAVIGLALSLVTLLKGDRSIATYASLILSIIPMVNFAFFVKASRIDSLILMLNLLLFFSLLIPKMKKFFKTVVLVLLLLGSILSASITALRTYVKGEEAEDLTEVSYWQTFSNSFTNSSTEVGMDLGNAALGIEYCYQNNDYDYGLQVWNGFVFNYVPKRLVGQETKESMYYKTGYQELVPILTNDITTMTGYFNAFSAFSFFGFIMFWVVGYAFGIVWQRAAESNLYRFFYFYVFSMVPIMITHGFQVVFQYAEFLMFFIYPLMAFFVVKITLRARPDKHAVPLPG